MYRICFILAYNFKRQLLALFVDNVNRCTKRDRTGGMVFGVYQDRFGDAAFKKANVALGDSNCYLVVNFIWLIP